MKTSVIIEAQALPEKYRYKIIDLAFTHPANPERPLAHIYDWFSEVKWNQDFTYRDVETVNRIIAILEGKKVSPIPRRGLLARLFGL